MSNRDQTPPPSHGPDPAPYGDLGGATATTVAPEPAKKNWFARHKILTTILAVLLLGSCVSALAGDEDDTAAPAATTTETSSEPVTSDEEGAGSSDSSSGATADEPAAEEEVSEDEGTEDATEDEAAPVEESTLPGIGDTVSVGDFEIVVTAVETGISHVGPEGWGEQAQGQFVKVMLTVKNAGNTAEMFFDSEQKLIDEQDREHSTSSAAFYLDESNLWLTDINPGNTATGALLFDIPTEAEPTTLKVRSGFFGRPSDIDLSS